MAVFMCSPTDRKENNCHSSAWLKDKGNIDCLASCSLAWQMVDLRPVFNLIRAAPVSMTLKDQICWEIYVQKGDAGVWLWSLLKETSPNIYPKKQSLGDGSLYTQQESQSILIVSGSLGLPLCSLPTTTCLMFWPLCERERQTVS